MQRSPEGMGFIVICIVANRLDMKKIKTQITIDASPEVVWGVLMNFEDYPDWNPFLLGIEGKAARGQELVCTIKPSGKKPMTFKPRVLKVEISKEFRWLGKTFVKGFFDGEHYFKLNHGPNGTTVLTHGENFTGLLSGVLFKMIGDATKTGFEAMNTALKARAEEIRKEGNHVR